MGHISISKEPAVLVGIGVAVVLAVVQTLAGQGVIGTDVVDTVAKAIQPPGGWALPIIVGFITRFTVYSPASVKVIAAQAAATGNPAVTAPPP